MEFAFDIGLWGLIALIVGSVFFGVGVQLLGNPHFGYEWLVTALVAGIGAFVASEFVVGFQTWEPLFDGLAVVPAVIVGVSVGLIAAGGMRFMTAEPNARPVS